MQNSKNESAVDNLTRSLGHALWLLCAVWQRRYGISYPCTNVCLTASQEKNHQVGFAIGDKCSQSIVATKHTDPLTQKCKMDSQLFNWLELPEASRCNHTTHLIILDIFGNALDPLFISCHYSFVLCSQACGEKMLFCTECASLPDMKRSFSLASEKHIWLAVLVSAEDFCLYQVHLMCRRQCTKLRWFSWQWLLYRGQTPRPQCKMAHPPLGTGGWHKKLNPDKNCRNAWG